MNNSPKTGPKSNSEIAEEGMRKKEILDKVAESNLPTRTILKELGISRSTYYSWLKRFQEEGMTGLMDSRSGPRSSGEVEEIDAEATGGVETAHVAVEAGPSAKEGREEFLRAPEAEAPVVEQHEPDQLTSKLGEGQGPERQEEVPFSGEKVEDVGGPGKKGTGPYVIIGLLALVVVVLLIMSVSNYNTYQVRQTGNTLTLWKGRVAPSGSEQVKSFAPIDIEGSDVSRLVGTRFAGRDAAHMAIFQYLMAQATVEANKGDKADLGKIDRLLAEADTLVGKQSSGTAGPRFELAQKRVAVAEMSLKRAYEKALPSYQEALRLQLGDRATLKAQIEAMKVALGLAVPQGEEQTGKEGKTTP
jgi:transposase-like protein